jgi:hypothetical protein
MKSYLKPFSLATAFVLGILSFQHMGHSQTSSSSNQSDYIFRFNTGISGVFLSNSTFPQQNPINLGSCTATEQINGPLICAVNCDNVPVCLLNVSGPPGASVTDVLEKVSETPAGQAASPTPSVSPSVSPSPSQLPGSVFGSMIFKSSNDRDANREKRIQIYNSAK